MAGYTLGLHLPVGACSFLLQCTSIVGLDHGYKLKRTYLGAAFRSEDRIKTKILGVGYLQLPNARIC